MKTWYQTEGFPYPVGVTYIAADDAYNFAIYSKNAESVTLLLYTETETAVPVVSKTLDFKTNKSQRIWHCRLSRAELMGAVYYAYSVSGNPNTGEPGFWQAFDPGKVLLDPFAKEVFFPPAFDAVAACVPGSNAGKAPLGYIHSGSEAFDWESDSVVRHEGDLVIYELHVKGFTMGAGSGVASDIQGTYAGVIAKIPYLVSLGITAVELMPVHQFVPSPTNYWGYSTLNFFAPHNGYSSDKSPGGAIREFKSMVKALHRAGIEVIMDVVFNHTTEGGKAGPVFSFKGLDNSTYYLMSDNPNDPYQNYSGTGNTMRTDHPVVQRLIVGSLLYWIKEMHIDGFRFDLASVFSRTSADDITSQPPIFAQLMADPEFQGIRFIAEPWDAGGGYQLGRAFPGNTWAQWNGKFRDDIRSFVKGNANLAGAAICRIYGSDDLFPGDLMNAYHPQQSINLITCHDGFTLYDVVAYNDKHNLANGENNKDGSDNNNSWNCGWEGDVGIVPQAVMELRLRQAKNLATILLLSNGIPMIVAGDEFLHTQGGNNNPYGQDNATAWLDWTRLTAMQQFYDFMTALIAFRKENPAISRSRFWRSDYVVFGFDGHPVNYTDPNLRYFAYHLLDSTGQGKELYVMVNAYWEPMNFTIAAQGLWKPIINTYLPGGQDIDPYNAIPVTSDIYLVGERSLVVLSR